MPEITDIRYVSRGSSARRVYLDGSEWRLVPAEVVRDLGLRTGQQCEPEELERRIAESAPARAFERAVRLLDFRDRGSEELRMRLAADGYSAAVVDAVLERVGGLGFLDDLRFAEGLARASIRKRHGRRRIAAELAAKGVDDALAAEVLAACCGAESEHERAVVLARKLAGRPPVDPRRLASRLAARGFDASVAWSAAREVADAPDGCTDVE